VAARVCVDCGGRFPPVNTSECPACGGKTYWKPFAQVDEDWEQKVSAAQDPQPPDYTLSKEAEWRRDELLKAGYSDTQALFLALARGVDLHQAVRVAKQSGDPDLAFRILS
jgi:predicted  nucleic acid-binding Zn-ribbon protein